jgi:hypothetical protein
MFSVNNVNMKMDGAAVFQCEEFSSFREHSDVYSEPESVSIRTGMTQLMKSVRKGRTVLFKSMGHLNSFSSEWK